MQRRTLSSGVALTELGFGAAQLGNLYRATSDEEAREAIIRARELGISYFDTAPHYGLGLSEQRLGSMLQEVPRDDVVVSTKVGRLLEPSPDRQGKLDEHFVVPATHRRVWDFSREGILRSLEASLDRLGLDRIDIVYLHDCDDHWDQASTQAATTLTELREQGVIRAWGAGLNQAPMTAEFIRRCDVDVMMIAGRFSLVDSAALTEVLPLAGERGVGIVAAAVFNSGLLSSPVVAADARFDYAEAPQELLERARRIADVCSSFGVSLPDAALAYPLRHSAVVSVVVGMRTAAQVDSNAERLATDIPSDLWLELESAGLIAAINPQETQP